MFMVDVRRAQSIGRRIADARRAGDRDKELQYLKRAEAMIKVIKEYGPDAQRAIDFGRRDQMKRTRRR
jgi:hypothetical protein